MIEIKAGVLVNPELIQYAIKFYLEDRAKDRYMLQLRFIGNCENFYFTTENERNEAYSKVYNATKSVHLTNTVKTSAERQWDL